ncbi:MAG TPA: flavodoxin domain-containing protein [Chitinophagaceae bacterium]|jgi:menaquinone-dependent protoporphyrinogen IX oxidase|nr:flavodoxin domain-containing protein [Chitinophagaceae bacterium]
MSALLVYKGRYGATQQYAGWIASSLHLDAVITDNPSVNHIQSADYIIAGSAVYFGKLLIGPWLKQHLHAIKEKKIFLFVVCGTPASETEKLQEYLHHSVPEEIRNRCEVFFLPGRMHYDQLSLGHRIAIRVANWFAGQRQPAIPLHYDKVERAALNPLLKAIRQHTGIKILEAV